MRERESICWSCKNAVPDRKGRGCAWSRGFIPVKGWQAERKLVKNCVGEFYETYAVTECPEYEEDES